MQRISELEAMLQRSDSLLRSPVRSGVPSFDGFRWGWFHAVPLVVFHQALG